MAKDRPERCCGDFDAKEHPDHSKEMHRINRISGQLEGVKRMISEREYCPKIITQIQAVRAALKSLESIVLEKHLEKCVKDALNSKDQRDAKAKMNELMDLFRRN
jgi:CsoR family transcriptional regulator, copper-sensing transcriptional repressor